MKVSKRIISRLEKCYSLALLQYHGQNYFLAAAEKQDECRLYDLDGNYKETVWEKPGGVMSMVQLPGTDGHFLATHKFYSPNDSQDAEIVLACPKENGWSVSRVAKLPFVHRFDILKGNHVNYLIVCTLKSGHKYKDDWSSPGKVYAAELPDDLSLLKDENQLEFQILKEGMYKNHGYCRCTKKGRESAVISCQQGVYQFIPPEQRGGLWTIQRLIDEPASDAVLIDLDGCGKEELFVMSPFHGDTVSIYKIDRGYYCKVYEYPYKLEFLHALYGGTIQGIPTVITGNRRNDRKLLAFRSDGHGGYMAQILDENTGAANVLHYAKDGKDIIVAANREIDEIAMYELGI